MPRQDERPRETAREHLNNALQMLQWAVDGRGPLDLNMVLGVRDRVQAAYDIVAEVANTPAAIGQAYKARLLL